MAAQLPAVSLQLIERVRAMGGFQPRSRVPEEPAGRVDGHAERRFGPAVLPDSEREEHRLAITLADITEEEFRLLEMIEAERFQESSVQCRSIELWRLRLNQ
jgi:hypothetical protein